MADPFQLHFDNSYAGLPEDFYTKMPAEGFAKAPWLIHANPKGAELIGLDAAALNDARFAGYFSGNAILPGSEPLAMAYSGHQFGQWAGQLGDGRALLLGQVRHANRLWDVQLKGSGKTPYSRFGDGRAVLRSCIREYLCSEAMHGLGIPTTRSLCITGTGEPVFRETVEPGAIFTRLAPSHIRFGHFEHFYYREQFDEVKRLADYVIDEYFPETAAQADRYQLWFTEVVRRTATLIAGWQAVGFSHGVMNTDNMSILGLTIDYGPFGFMEAFDPGFICNDSDHSGRYAYDQQPGIGLWNLHALAHALQPVLAQEASAEILKRYAPVLSDTYYALMRRKLGVQDDALWLALLGIMKAQASDYTLTFRYLPDTFDNPQRWLSLFAEPEIARRWLADYHAHVKASGMATDALRQHLNAVNPKFVLRNWVAETAIRAAEDESDYSMIGHVLALVHAPYGEHPAFDTLAAPAPQAYRELCVSCSS